MDQARQWLRDARRIAVLTGAGVSAESGIPTFRGDGGLWRQFRAEDPATAEAFSANPKLVWEWYNWRRGLIAAANPNPAHLALVTLEQRVPAFTLITQNVDGLHSRAGSTNIVYLHGDIWTVRCLACGVSRKEERPQLPELPPQCQCGGLLRPGVVWFGEGLHQDRWRAAEQATRDADVFLIVGTSAVVMPAGGLAALAKRGGAKLIEVNADATWISDTADCSLRGPAGSVLPHLIED